MSREPLKLYRPANGTEGDWFESEFCDRCKFEDTSKERFCDIHTAALLFLTDEANYPREWRYDATGHPTCTAFVDKGDKDDDRESPRPPDPDPLQLNLLADPTEDVAMIALAEPDVCVVDSRSSTEFSVHPPR